MSALTKESFGPLTAPEARPDDRRQSGPLEWLASILVVAIVGLLLAGVVSRYALGSPLTWVDEIVSLAFIWLTMLGAVIASRRHEHLRLTLVIDRLPEHLRRAAESLGLCLMAAFLIGVIPAAMAYTRDEALVMSPALGFSNAYRVAALPFGIVAMLVVVVVYALRTFPLRVLAPAAVAVAAAACALWWGQGLFATLGSWNLLLFLGLLVLACLACGVPIAFCFGLGVLAYLGVGTSLPLQIIIGRMDEGMSSIILVSVPIFVLLGCVLDSTGMGKSIVDLLAGLVGHLRAGMSYVLLGSLFIVSGISGSKVSDMATVAPALFPEMKRRGHKPPEMVALLATGAAMADTVPPSIVLIVLGSVAGVSIAGLFQSGFVVALVLLFTLLAFARWKARREDMSGARRPTLRGIGSLALIATPALVLPFLIRGAVGEGIATATEVSTIAVLYAMLIGQILYGGIGLRKLQEMLVETAALSGAIFLILGTASAMAWAITQSGLVQSLTGFLTALPGGVLAFMVVTMLVFVVLGCLLEGLPAVLLLAPIMFPIARKLGINDIHYSMVMVVAMNVGLMLPPIGVGFYVACRIGGSAPDAVMRAIWPYLTALIAGLIVIAAVPAISTVAL